MRIVFDARCVHERMHGIARYSVEVLKCLGRLDREDHFIVLILPAGKPHLPVLPPNFEVFLLEVPPYTLSEHFKIPMFLKKFEYDVFYSPTYQFPLLVEGRVIMTIHDVIPLSFPRGYNFIRRYVYRKLVSACIKRAEKVLTVSEASREEIRRFFGDNKKIYVISPGISEKFSPQVEREDEDVLSRFGVSPPYVVWVGNERSHKNFLNTVRAFEILRKIGQKVSLLMIGISPEMVMKSIRDPKGIQCVEYVDDEALVAFLRNAEFAVLPSFHEGFCLPALEAMACGCPLIVSHIPPFIEVVGEAGLMVNPFSPEDIAEKMLFLLENREKRALLREEGLKRANKFSWERTASTLLKILLHPEGFE